ncbi:Hypothetical predicted protein, partial [Olea europaea subsp. europaea]
MVVVDSQRMPWLKKASWTSNSYDFYYYSGFGPRWDKERGENSLDVPKNLKREHEMIHPTFPQIDNEESEIKYEVEDEEDGESWRKRARKPIKA